MKRKCLTPGAFWFFKKDEWRPSLDFSVSVPREVLDKLGERKCRELEKAFHDAIEPILGPRWPKTWRGKTKDASEQSAKGGDHA
jgi:hypothetical protein